MESEEEDHDNAENSSAQDKTDQTSEDGEKVDASNSKEIENETAEKEDNGSSEEVKEKDNKAKKVLETTKRDTMTDEITKLLEKNEKIKKENEMLQNKLSTTFFNKPTDKLNFQEINLPLGANEDTYNEILRTIEAISTETSTFSDTCEKQLISLKITIEEKEQQTTELSNEFYDLKENTALRAVNSQTGERFHKENVKALLDKEENQNRTMLQFRLKSIRERHALDKAIKRKRALTTAEGALNFADFETMVTELQNNKVKIPRVRKEVESLEKRCQNIINVMSHVSQKLHFVQAEKSTAAAKTKIMADEVNKMRKTLFHEKAQYDRMKAENEELQHKFILLQHPELIEDFKESEVKLKEGIEKLNTIKSIFTDTMNIISNKPN